MPGIGLTDNPALGGARVDTNHDLGVALQPDEGEAGFAALTVESNPDGVGVGRRTRALEASADYRLRIGIDAFLFRDVFCHAQINTSKYKVVNTTMLNALSGGRWVLNSGSSVGSAVGTQVQSYATFSFGLSGCLYADFEAAITQDPQANNVIEFGLAQASGVTSPLDGVMFRLNAAGTWDGVIINASAETSVALVSATGVPYIVPPNEMHHFTIGLHNDIVDFWIDDILVGKIDTPLALGSPMGAMSAPLFARIYNSGITAIAQQLLLQSWSVTSGDVDSNRLWPTMNVVMGNSCYNVPDGTAAGSTGSYVFSTAPVTVGAASQLSSTAAYTSLGGQFALASIASAETDILVFSYLNPAPSASIPGKNLLVRGVTIDAVSTGVVGSAISAVQQWSLAVGGTQVSATTESAVAGTRGGRRVPLGFLAFPVNTPIGSCAVKTIDINLDAPVAVEPGTYFNVHMKPIVGPINAGQVFRGTCFVNGYFE
jgi:hypothetical protein